MTVGAYFTFSIVAIVFALMMIGLFLLAKDLFFTVSRHFKGSTLVEMVFLGILFIIGILITGLTWYITIKLFQLLFLGGQ